MSDKNIQNQNSLESVRAENERLRLKNKRLSQQTSSVAEANANAAELMIELEEANELLKEEIRKRQEAEEKFKQAAFKEKQANECKTVFLANMSHEIRTPMNAIIGFTDLLTDEPLSETQQDFVETISAAGKSLLQIINDILDFSKIEAGKLEVEIIDSDLRSIVKEVFNMLSATAKGKGLDFVVNLCKPLPQIIKTDPTRLRQCLINLANNAIKFTEEGCVEINVSMSSCRDTEQILQLSVRDSGIGIEPDKVEKIFSAFSQADGSMNRKYGGSGLGLSITKRLTEMLGGSVKVSSEFGKGSEFTISLPVSSVIEEAVAAGKS